MNRNRRGMVWIRGIDGGGHGLVGEKEEETGWYGFHMVASFILYQTGFICTRKTLLHIPLFV